MQIHREEKALRQQRPDQSACCNSRDAQECQPPPEDRRHKEGPSPAVSEEHSPADTLTLGLLPLEPRDNVHLVSHPGCGSVLWWPKEVRPIIYPVFGRTG